MTSGKLSMKQALVLILGINSFNFGLLTSVHLAHKLQGRFTSLHWLLKRSMDTCEKKQIKEIC
ncbi:hypothetical protein Prudu_001879, partial [Prunus dulcis]